MNEEDVAALAQGAAGLALAASALAEAAQALSEAAAALSSMGQDSKLSETPNNPFKEHTRSSETHEIHSEKDPAQDILDDDDSSVGANTRDNTHPRDTTQGVRHREGSPTPTTSYHHTKPDTIGGKDPLNTGSPGELVCPRRSHLVLEEEFDALPLVLAYATAAKRTICYVPTSGSLFPWESILSAIIPGRQVRSAISFAGNSIMQLGDVIEQFASPEDGSVLVLRPMFIARANENKAHSISHSVIFWGLPGSKFWSSLIDASQQSKHTLLILGQREYRDPTCQTFLNTIGSSFNTIHPQHLELNSFQPGSMLTSFRENVQRTVSRAQYSQNIQNIYEELLESPINDTGSIGFVTKSSTERIDVVNKFVARVFLRGRIQDGSSRFTFNGQGLQIPEKSYKRMGTIFGTNTQPIKDDATFRPKPEARQPVVPPIR